MDFAATKFPAPPLPVYIMGLLVAEGDLAKVAEVGVCWISLL